MGEGIGMWDWWGSLLGIDLGGRFTQGIGFSVEGDVSLNRR